MTFELPGILAAGTRLGAYEVVRMLGEGGMAHVCEARHTILGKRVALKILRVGPGAPQATAARLVREGRAASAVRHPNIVEIFEIGEERGTPYLVMELLDGVDLAEHLRRRDRLSIAETVEIVLPVISALGAAHAAGVIHRDLKPSNVFLADAAGGIEPKLLDFGISKLVDTRDELTLTQALLGTLHYMSPEQTRGAKNIDALSDQYSLGVVLYECATGTKPFSGESSYDLMHTIVTAPLRAPSSRDSSLPRAFDDVVLRAMSRDPRDRFPSIYHLGLALLPFAPEATSARWRAELVTHASTIAPKKDERRASARPPESTLAGATVGEERTQTKRRTWRAVVGVLTAVATLSAVAAAGVSHDVELGATIPSNVLVSSTLGLTDGELRADAPASAADPKSVAPPPSQQYRSPVGPTPRGVAPAPAQPATSAPARAAAVASISVGRNESPIIE